MAGWVEKPGRRMKGRMLIAATIWRITRARINEGMRSIRLASGRIESLATKSLRPAKIETHTAGITSVLERKSLR